MSAAAYPLALRAWRTRRRVSQLELALRAGTTQRHISFIEGGRSAPGRAMVVRLAEALDVPLRERNAMLLAAGYAPAYPETRIDDPALEPVRSALERVLAAHLPYPAVVVDRHGDLVSANDAFWALTAGVAEALRNPDDRLTALAAELEGYVPPRAPEHAQLGFAVPLELRSPAGDLRLLTTLTHFGTAVDVTVAELRMEAFLPGDAQTAAALPAIGG